VYNHRVPRFSSWLLVAACAVLGDGSAARQSPAAGPELLPRTTLHAHNCYPDLGRYPDRLSRALNTGITPIAIEQDLVWAPLADGGRSVVSHGEPLNGYEPTLEAHFFKRVERMLDTALASGRHDDWPLLILHLDFKTNEPEHHRAVWDLLGKYQRWLTTAERVADDGVPPPLRPGPLLVLTENGAGQHAVFHDRVAVGDRLRLFGTVPVALDLASLPREDQLRQLAAAPVETLIPQRATNYRRWSNQSWAAIEEGGQANAGDWTPAEDRRLRALVDRARAMQLWLRIYALNGHAANAGQGWSEGYNFGSLAAVQRRWDAAIAAGVHLVATDQYELFAARLRRVTSRESGAP
jgi:hypothetical protein